MIEHLRVRGSELMAETEALIARAGAEDLIALSGEPAWSFLHFTPPEGTDLYAVKTLFLQEVFARGVFTLGTHNMSLAHGDEELTAILTAYGEVIPLIAEACRAGDVARRLRCAPLQPLFKVR